MEKVIVINRITWILLLSLAGLNNTIAQSDNDTTIESGVFYRSKIDDSIKVNKYFVNNNLVKSESFYLNGQRESIYHYKNGVFYGDLIDWYESGALYYKAIKNGGNGRLTYWFENGNIKSKAYFHHNKGILMSYYESGELESLKTIDSDGVFIGLCQTFSKDGNRLVETDFSEKPRPITIYYKSGIVKEKGFLNENLEKVGTWFFYDENGKVLRTDEYERGIKISETKE